MPGKMTGCEANVVCWFQMDLDLGKFFLKTFSSKRLAYLISSPCSIFSVLKYFKIFFLFQDSYGLK